MTLVFGRGILSGRLLIFEILATAPDQSRIANQNIVAWRIGFFLIKQPVIVPIVCLNQSKQTPAQNEECRIHNVKKGLSEMHLTNRIKQAGATGYILLWLLGIPIPILLLIFLLRGCT